MVLEFKWSVVNVKVLELFIHFQLLFSEVVVAITFSYYVIIMFLIEDVTNFL